MGCSSIEAFSENQSPELARTAVEVSMLQHKRCRDSISLAYLATALGPIRWRFSSSMRQQSEQQVIDGRKRAVAK